MRRLMFLMACLFMVGIGLVNALTRSCSGKVISMEDGQPIIGATVMIKGTTVGTITNYDGEFKINVPENGKKLVVSYVGMKTIEVDATNDIVIKLKTDDSQLKEVVVTAMGISRDKKSLGYAVQEVSGDAVNQVKSDNFVTSLSGKVSGIQVKNNTNFGGSTNVIIRGSSSLTGSNQALFVVDGVPVDNSNDNNTGQLTGRNGYDYGNAASDINPNDIESISILKGAAATALYGSRASHGVVLITTKKGKSAKKNVPNVRISSNVTVSNIDKSTFPTYQNQYGAGYANSGYSDSAHPGLEHYADVNGDGTIDYTTPYYEDASRGEKFDPSLKVYQWDAFDLKSPNYGKATPWVAGANGPATFFNTGVSTSNNVDISGGDENTIYRFSYTNFNQDGVMPNSNLEKNNALFNGSHKITDNLTISTSANYINTAGKGRPSTGYNDNIMSSFRQWYEVNVDMGMQKKMFELTGTNATWNRNAWDDGAAAYWDNPYWLRANNYETDGRSRLIGYAQLDWKITKDLKAMGRYSMDTYNELQEERKAVGSSAGEFGVGRANVTSGYSRFTRAFTETNIDFMLNYHKTITDKLDLTGILGTNMRRTKTESVYASTNNGLSVPGIYALSNSVDAMLPPVESLTQVGVNGIYGSVSLGFDNIYFLDATIRRDQSSTLPEKNNSYFYPSVTGSYIFSNVLSADWLSLGKLRLNYAEVGSSAPALSIKDTYTQNATFSGNALVTVPDTKLNENLKPERQRALEGGLEMSFLKSRLGFDLALYKNNTVDQLMPVSVSYATGYAQKWVNAGEIENKGVELSLTGTPVKTKDFKWDVRVNWAKNKNTVASLYTDESGNKVTNLQIASLQGGVSINARVGEAYGAITGSDFVYTNGQKTVDPTTGHYLLTPTNDKVIGNVTPDWTGGISNTFTYKNLSLSFLIDIQHGGSVFSLDEWYGSGTGLYAESVGPNDLGNPKRNAIIWANPDDHSKGYSSTSGGTINPGVLPDGSKNTVRVDNSDYTADGWAVSPDAKFVYDASYVKLREVTITYNLPKSVYSKLYLTNASIGVVGSNLWIISKNLPYADPEASQSSGNIQGWQTGVMPATRNIGFTLNLQF
ncbi:MAG: SusC/RagA family TonB-linked outer membrane protein [Bacteroidota bacterium]|nr:SusC/RagA family TonB-linked outer membrane protein [Bacteroidota bacterium]